MRRARSRSTALAASAAALCIVLAGCASAPLPPAGSPERTEMCRTWIERKGYPVDYIEKRTGRRQPGFAANWKGNVDPAQVQVADIVVTRHVTQDGVNVVSASYVEEVIRDGQGRPVTLTVSAMNRSGGHWVDKDCQVSSNFGIVTTDKIPFTMVQRVWRPDLPLP